MKTPSSIITELPSSLWNSPLFEAYDYYVSGIDTALDHLHSDLEGMFHLRDVSQTTFYMLDLNTNLQKQVKRLDLEEVQGFDRLIRAAAYTDYPVESIFWLFRLASKIHMLRKRFSQTGLALNIGNYDNAIAFIHPLLIGDRSTSRGTAASFKGDYRFR